MIPTAAAPAEAVTLGAPLPPLKPTLADHLRYRLLHRQPPRILASPRLRERELLALAAVVEFRISPKFLLGRRRQAVLTAVEDLLVLVLHQRPQGQAPPRAAELRALQEPGGLV